MADILTEFESKQKQKQPASLYATKVAYTLIGILIIVSYYALFHDPLYQENIKSFSWYHITLAIDLSQLIWLLLLFFNKKNGLIGALLCQAHILGIHILNPFLATEYEISIGTLYFSLVVMLLNAMVLLFGFNKKNWEYLKAEKTTRIAVILLAVCTFVLGLVIKIITS